MQKSVKAGLLTVLMLVSLGLSVLILNNGELQAASKPRLTRVFRADDAPKVIKQLSHIVSSSHGVTIKETKPYGDAILKQRAFDFQAFTDKGNKVNVYMDTKNLKNFVKNVKIAVQEGDSDTIQSIKPGKYDDRMATFQMIGVVEDGRKTEFKVNKVRR